jgi:hypothetical protein
MLVGAVRATYEADASKWEAEGRRAQAALAGVRTQATATTQALQQTTAAANQNQAAAAGLTKTARGAKESLANLAGGLGQVAGAMGMAGGAAQKLVGGLSGALGMIGSGGGPLAAGLLAVGLASAFVTAKMKEQEDAAAAVDARWKELTATATTLKLAASETFADLQKRVAIESQKTGGGISDQVTEMQLLALERGKQAMDERLKAEQQILAIEKQIVGNMTDAQRADLQALQAKVSELTTVEKLAEKEFELAPKLGEQLERQARAARARAEAEANALAAQKELEALLRSRRVDAFVSGAMPNAGQLQPSSFVASADVVAPAFAQLTMPDWLKSPSHAAALPDAGALERANAGLEILAINLPNASMTVREAREALAQLAIDADRAAGAMAANLIGAAATGNLGAAGGQALGELAGGAIGSMFGGAELGAGIGGALGSIIGGALDTTMNALQLFAPLFEGLGVAVKALTPILLVWGVLFTALGHTLATTAPLLAALAEPIAALLLVVVRVVVALLPFVEIVLLAVGGLLAFLEVITAGIGWLDRNFFIPMATGAQFLFNGFVDIYNAAIETIRKAPGFEDFGVLMDKNTQAFTSVIDEFATNMDEIRGYGAEDIEDAVARGSERGVATGMDAWSRAMQNLPGYYKGVPGAEYASADAMIVNVNGPLQQFNGIHDAGEAAERARQIKRTGLIGVTLSRRGHNGGRN